MNFGKTPPVSSEQVMVFRVIVEFDLTIGTGLYQQSDNFWSDVGTLHHDTILDKLTLYTGTMIL